MLKVVSDIAAALGHSLHSSSETPLVNLPLLQGLPQRKQTEELGSAIFYHQESDCSATPVFVAYRCKQASFMPAIANRCALTKQLTQTSKIGDFVWSKADTNELE
jgi:hypothetical protein